MISSRRKDVHELIELLIFWEIAEQAICIEHKILPEELKALMILFYIQRKTNELVDLEQFAKIFVGQHYKAIQGLERSELAKREKRGINVTIKGEYVVRACTRILNEKISGTDLPKWKRVKIDDERRALLRPAGNKGTQFY